MWMQRWNRYALLPPEPHDACATDAHRAAHDPSQMIALGVRSTWCDERRAQGVSFMIWSRYTIGIDRRHDGAPQLLLSLICLHQRSPVAAAASSEPASPGAAAAVGARAHTITTLATTPARGGR